MKFSVLGEDKIFNYFPASRHKGKVKNWINPKGYKTRGQIQIVLRESLWVPYRLVTNEKD